MMRAPLPPTVTYMATCYPDSPPPSLPPTYPASPSPQVAWNDTAVVLPAFETYGPTTYDTAVVADLVATFSKAQLKQAVDNGTAGQDQACCGSHHHHHHQKAFRNKSYTSHGHRPGLKRNKSKGKILTINYQL